MRRTVEDVGITLVVERVVWFSGAWRRRLFKVHNFSLAFAFFRYDPDLLGLIERSHLRVSLSLSRTG